jgi:dephospho-CoA kinase
MPAIAGALRQRHATADGALDRDRMRELVFADAEPKSAWKPSCTR